MDTWSATNLRTNGLPVVPLDGGRLDDDTSLVERRRLMAGTNRPWLEVV